MDKFKRLVEKSNDLLNEAKCYADEYKSCDDSSIKDLWYSLGSMHLDGYNKTRMIIAAYITKHEKDEPDIPIIWSFIKSMQDDFLTEIKKSM